MKSDVEEYRTEIKKKNGDVTRVDLDIQVEGDDYEHDMRFKPVEKGEDKVKMVRHRLPQDYKEDKGGLGSIDYRENLTDGALNSVQIARKASEEILNDNAIELVREDE